MATRIGRLDLGRSGDDQSGSHGYLGDSGGAHPRDSCVGMGWNVLSGQSAISTSIRRSPIVSEIGRRGDLRPWFSAEAIEAWHVPRSGTPVGQRVYSDLAIETALTVRSVYHLGLRQTEGFLRSVCTLLGLSIRIPDHSTLSRRSSALAPAPLCPGGPGGPIHILIDSTGLKVHRGPEPLPKQNRRQWRKLHVVVDADTGDILASEITTRGASDGAQVPGLLAETTRELASVMADGAYDTERVYSTIEARPSSRPTQILIPPRRNAPSALRSARPSTRSRDYLVQTVRRLGVRRWRTSSGYMRRSFPRAVVQQSHFLRSRRVRPRMSSFTTAGAANRARRPTTEFVSSPSTETLS